jgi:hypothetical protein
MKHSTVASGSGAVNGCIAMLAAWACMGGAACFSSSSGGAAPDASFPNDGTNGDDGGPGADASSVDSGAPLDTGAAVDASPDDATAVGDAGPIASASGTCVADAGATAGTAPTTINFDTWPDGGMVAAGTLIQYQYPGVVFSSSACGGGVINDDGEASSAPNFLVGNPGSFQPIVMDLASPASQVGVTLISVGSATVTATAYDATLTNVLDSKSVTHPGAGTGFGAHDPVTLSGTGIVRVVIAITTAYPGDGYGIDDVTLQ